MSNTGKQYIRIGAISNFRKISFLLKWFAERMREAETRNKKGGTSYVEDERFITHVG